MVSLRLRKGFPSSAAIEPPRAVHAFEGAVNFRRCATCGRTPVQAQLLPFALCVAPAPQLPFERPDAATASARRSAC